jgi:hypothetical protein
VFIAEGRARHATHLPYFDAIFVVVIPVIVFRGTATKHYIRCGGSNNSCLIAGDSAGGVTVAWEEVPL